MHDCDVVVVGAGLGRADRGARAERRRARRAGAGGPGPRRRPDPEPVGRRAPRGHRRARRPVGRADPARGAQPRPGLRHRDLPDPCHRQEPLRGRPRQAEALPRHDPDARAARDGRLRPGGSEAEAADQARRPGGTVGRGGRRAPRRAELRHLDPAHREDQDRARGARHRLPGGLLRSSRPTSPCSTSSSTPRRRAAGTTCSTPRAAPSRTGSRAEPSSSRSGWPRSSATASQLSAPVRAIRADADGVVAGEVRARRAIVAVPPALAGRIDYDPPLPGVARPAHPADADGLGDQVHGGL